MWPSIIIIIIQFNIFFSVNADKSLNLNNLPYNNKIDSSILCYFPQLSLKKISQNASPNQKTEGKEESDLKDEEKKGSTDGPASTTEEKKVQEESKEETKQTKQDAEVKEEKSG